MKEFIFNINWTATCENRLSGGVRGEKHTKCYPLLDFYISITLDFTFEQDKNITLNKSELLNLEIKDKFVLACLERNWWIDKKCCNFILSKIIYVFTNQTKYDRITKVIWMIKKGSFKDEPKYDGQPNKQN